MWRDATFRGLPLCIRRKIRLNLRRAVCRRGANPQDVLQSAHDGGYASDNRRVSLEIAEVNGNLTRRVAEMTALQANAAPITIAPDDLASIMIDVQQRSQAGEETSRLLASIASLLAGRRARHERAASESVTNASRNVLVSLQAGRPFCEAR
jgi:hypothetical protein